MTDPAIFMRFDLGDNTIAELSISTRPLSRDQLRQLRAYLDVWWGRRLGLEEPSSDSDVAFEVPTCRVCGCTDDDCDVCVDAQGHACWWVEDPEGLGDLCSRCLSEVLDARHAPTPDELRDAGGGR